MLNGVSAVLARAISRPLPSSLGRRIVARVAVGLALVLVLFSVVAVWTVQGATQSAYAERVGLAQALVWHVDDILGYSLAALESEATGLSIEPGYRLSDLQTAQLAVMRLQMSQFSSMALIDVNGLVLWSEPTISDIDPRRSAAAVFASGTPQVTELLVSDGERALANFAVPVRDRGGELVGVLTADVDPGQPGLNLLPVRPVGDAVQVHMINSAGLTLAGSVQDEADREMNTAHATLLAVLIKSHLPGYRIHDPSPTVASDGTVFQIGRHIVAYAPVSVLPSWGVVVEQPNDVVLASTRELEIRLGFAGATMLLLAGAIAWLDVRRVVQPLQRLTDAARRFAAGDLEEPIRLHRSDELGVLAHSFETMRQRLRASLAEVSEWNRELERRVAARTAEVEGRNRELANLNALVRARERERAELLQKIIAGQEEERRRLAQELHDQTSQALASLQLGLDRLSAGVDDEEDARGVASDLRVVAEQTLEAVHHLAVELRPSVLDDVGLVAALQRYVREWAEQTHIQSDFAPVSVDGLRLVPAAETAVYRIVQAALTNVAQHAEARHVSVILQRRGETMIAVVEDDGRGFDPASIRSRPLDRRLGLAGMEERAKLIGATLTLESSPGIGSSVFLEVPLDVNALREDVRAVAAPATG